MRLRFPRTAHLTRAAEFSRLRREGEPFHGKFMMLAVLRVESETGARIGILTPRRLGSAVVRNRVRRRLREIVRLTRAQLASGFWLVVMAKPRSVTATYAELQEDWTRLMQRGSILAPCP